MAGKLRRVGTGTPLIIERPGLPGRDGKDGVTKVITETITKVEAGIPGAKGEQGATPEHEVRNGEIRFKNPDGTWGKWVVAPRGNSGGGAISHNTYTNVTQAVYRVRKQSLLLGHNIFGVNYAGDVTIYLPDGIDPRAIIVVNDESNNAGTFNITVTTET